MWFKWFLFGYLVLVVLANLHEVSKGEYQHKSKPFISALSALIGTLLSLGILYYF